MMTSVILNQVSEKKGLRVQVLNSKAVRAMANLFSRITGEKVSPLKAIHALNAQISFAALLLLGGISVLVAALLLVWFVLSVYQCSQNKGV